MVHKLYVIVRSDLKSMTPGKAAAQVAHAASMASFMAKDRIGDQEFVSDPDVAAYLDWELSPLREVGGGTVDPDLIGFGTTIVLDGGDLSEVEAQPPFANGIWGRVRDPSYPVRDGMFTHLVDLVTCHWCFCDPDGDTRIRDFLDGFRLFDGYRPDYCSSS